jgi:hypothetical protein
MIDVKPYFEDVIDSLSEMNLSKKRNRTKENPKGDSWFTLLMNQRDQHKFERTLYGAKEVKPIFRTLNLQKVVFSKWSS